MSLRGQKYFYFEILTFKIRTKYISIRLVKILKKTFSLSDQWSALRWHHSPDSLPLAGSAMRSCGQII